jgi:hypothetical protein
MIPIVFTSLALIVSFYGSYVLPYLVVAVPFIILIPLIQVNLPKWLVTGSKKATAATVSRTKKIIANRKKNAHHTSH